MYQTTNIDWATDDLLRLAVVLFEHRIAPHHTDAILFAQRAGHWCKRITVRDCVSRDTVLSSYCVVSWHWKLKGLKICAIYVDTMLSFVGICEGSSKSTEHKLCCGSVFSNDEIDLSCDLVSSWQLDSDWIVVNDVIFNSHVTNIFYLNSIIFYLNSIIIYSNSRKSCT